MGSFDYKYDDEDERLMESQKAWRELAEKRKDEIAALQRQNQELRERLHHWAYMFRVIAEDKQTAALLLEIERVGKE